MLCKQEAYLKYYVDEELVTGDVKGFNWNDIIKFPCPVLSSLNEVIVLLGLEFLRTIVVRTGDNPLLEDCCVLAHRAKQTAYRKWS